MIVTFTNSKLGDQIASINLPAITTCRKDAPCKHLCYACKNRFKFKNVIDHANNNLKFFKSDKKNYFNEITIETASLKIMPRFARWHSSGDIVNNDYLLGMIDVAKKNKYTIYLCFTKKYELINSYLSSGKKLPKNLKIVFSNWKDLPMPNPFNLPVAYVDGIGVDLPQNAKKCTGVCYKCLQCWQLKKNESVIMPLH